MQRKSKPNNRDLNLNSINLANIYFNDVVSVFVLLTSKISHFSSVSVVVFEQENVSWVTTLM